MKEKGNERETANISRNTFLAENFGIHMNTVCFVYIISILNFTLISNVNRQRILLDSYVSDRYVFSLFSINYRESAVVQNVPN